MAVDQYEVASKLATMAADDGHVNEGEGLDGLDLLDYMASLGVEFAEGTGATNAYHEHVAAQR